MRQKVVPMCRAEAPLVVEEDAVAVEDDPDEPEVEPAPAVLAALFVDGLPAVEVADPEEVRVAMLMVVFLNIAVPVPALAPLAVPTVAGTIGTVVDAVPFAESVLLMYELGPAVADDEEAELTAEATAPCTSKGPK